MPVAVLMEFPGSDTDLYDKVMEEMQLESMPEGGIAHIAAQTENGLRVLDVWESAEQFQQLYETQLKGALARAGVTDVQPPKIGPVHNVMTIEHLPFPAEA